MSGLIGIVFHNQNPNIQCKRKEPNPKDAKAISKILSNLMWRVGGTAVTQRVLE